jgi:hypothetical protein
VAELVNKMKELGTITPDDTWLEDFNDSIADVKKSFMSLMSIIFRMVGPAMLQITTWVKQANVWIRQHEIAVKSFAMMVAGLITALLIPTFLEFFAVLLANPITWVVVILGLLALAMEDLIVWCEGGDSALGELWEAIFGSPEEAKQTYETIVQALKDIWETIQPLIKAFKEWWQTLSIGEKAIASISPFGLIFELGQEAGEMFVSWMLGKMTELAEWLKAQFDAVGEWINQVWQSICDYCGSVIDAMIGFFVNLKDQIIALIGEAIDWAIGKLGELASKIASVPIIGGAIDLGVSAYNSITGGGGNTTNNSSDVRVGTINVNTQSTDAYGISRDIAGATRNAYSYQQANGGAY